MRSDYSSVTKGQRPPARSPASALASPRPSAGLRRPLPPPPPAPHLPRAATRCALPHNVAAPPPTTSRCWPVRTGPPSDLRPPRGPGADLNKTAAKKTSGVVTGMCNGDLSNDNKLNVVRAAPRPTPWPGTRARSPRTPSSPPACLTGTESPPRPPAAAPCAARPAAHPAALRRQDAQGQLPLLPQCATPRLPPPRRALRPPRRPRSALTQRPSPSLLPLSGSHAGVLAGASACAD